MVYISMEVMILHFIKKHKFLTAILLLLSLYVFFNYTRVVDYKRNTDTKDKHYVNELYNTFDFDKLNNFLKEINEWENLFKFKQDYTHPIKYFKYKIIK